jgi:uncharacterized coiled-coil protein SlyX
MARQPDDLVLRVLKNVQATLAEHSKQLERMEKKLEDLADGTIAALGLATQQNLRQDRTDARLDQLELRVARLEKKR